MGVTSSDAELSGHQTERISCQGLVYLRKDDKRFVFNAAVGVARVHADLTDEISVGTWIRFFVDAISGQFGSVDNPYDARECLPLSKMPPTVVCFNDLDESVYCEFHKVIRVPDDYNGEKLLFTLDYGPCRVDMWVATRLRRLSGHDVDVWFSFDEYGFFARISGGWKISQIYEGIRGSYGREKKCVVPSRPTSLLNYTRDQARTIELLAPLPDLLKTKGARTYHIGCFIFYYECVGVIIDIEEEGEDLTMWSGDVDERKFIPCFVETFSKRFTGMLRPGMWIRFNGCRRLSSDDMALKEVALAEKVIPSFENRMFKTVVLHRNAFHDSDDVFVLYSVTFGSVVDVHKVLVPTDNLVFLEVWVESLQSHPGFCWKISAGTDVRKCSDGFCRAPLGTIRMESGNDPDGPSTTNLMIAAKDDRVPAPFHSHLYLKMDINPEEEKLARYAEIVYKKKNREEMLRKDEQGLIAMAEALEKRKVLRMRLLKEQKLAQDRPTATLDSKSAVTKTIVL